MPAATPPAWLTVTLLFYIGRKEIWLGGMLILIRAVVKWCGPPRIGRKDAG